MGGDPMKLVQRGGRQAERQGDKELKRRREKEVTLVSPCLHDSGSPCLFVSPRSCFLRALLATIAGVVLLAPARAGADYAKDGTSSRAARNEAVRAVPWQQLTPGERRSVQSVINRAGIYRRLPTRVIDCDPEMFAFLVQHPEVVVDVWRVMGISRVKLDKLPDGAFRGSDGAGTTGTVRYLSGQWGEDGKNTALVLAEGAYEGKPFLAPLKARTVVLLRTGALQDRSGRHYITVHVDSFVDVEQAAIEWVAKTVQPWVNSTADRNFVETLKFVSNFSRTAEKNPDGMRRLAARLTTVDEPTRNELVQLCYRTAQRYVQHERARRTSSTLVVRHDGVPVVYVK